MKIGLFTELFPPNMGGQEIRFQQIARGLAARGHQVEVFCIRHARDLLPREAVDGYTVHRYPLAPKYEQPTIHALRRSPIAVVRYAWWTRQVLARRQFDLVFMNQWPYLHIIAAPRAARARMVIDWCEARNGLPYRIAQRLLPRVGHANVAVSPGVAGRIAQASGCRPLYLPSGIHVADYAPGEPSHRHDLLSLGRLVEHKNFELLVQAFGTAVERGYPHGLLIAGSGPYEGALRDQVERSPLRSRIHLLGRVTDAEKVRLLSRADMLVITSRREGFPRIIAEAMASGLPTVTVDFPDNASRDVVRLYDVGHVAPPTPTGVAAAIMQTMGEGDALRARCVTAAQALDWRELLPMLENLAACGPSNGGTL